MSLLLSITLTVFPGFVPAPTPNRAVTLTRSDKVYFNTGSQRRNLANATTGTFRSLTAQLNQIAHASKREPLVLLDPMAPECADGERKTLSFHSKGAKEAFIFWESKNCQEWKYPTIDPKLIRESMETLFRTGLEQNKFNQ